MVLNNESLWKLGLVISLNILAINAGDSVPVLLWGGDGRKLSPEPINPLQKISRGDFEKILKLKIGKSLPPMLIFVRDSFCVEDLMQNKEHLKKFQNAGTIYLPAVESPFSVLENLPSYNSTDGENQLEIIEVTDWESIAEVYNTLRESSPNVVAALTGRSCIYSRSDRVKRSVGNDTTVLFNKSSVLFYASQYPFIQTEEGQGFEQLSSLSPGSDAQRQGKTVIMSLIFTSPNISKLTLKFNFTMNRGYYKLISLMYSTDKTSSKEIILHTNNEIIVPSNFSYHCSQKTIFRNGSIILNITNMQMQLDATEGKFSDAYDCVGFTTIPIWTGIFVTAILALIMIWGLTMIMDIRTMDRFDDPKGKTITISAQE